MKYLLVICLFAACNTKQIPPKVIHDTIRITSIDTLRVVDTVLIGNCDSLRKAFVIQKKQLQKRNFQVTKARYYLTILDKNPKYVVYIKGWLNNRALKD